MQEIKTVQPDTSEWVELYGDYLYNYAVGRVFSKDLAKDLVQDTFLSALKAWSRFESKSSVKTWLVRILKNKIIDHYRKKARNAEDNIIDKPFRVDGEYVGHWLDSRLPSKQHPATDQNLSTEEFMRILQLCLDLLSPKAAAVFSLKIIEEIETDEVCKDLDITSSNLWVLLHRARLQMRECLEHKWLKE